jgi:tripeptide aminopeptidase
MDLSKDIEDFLLKDAVERFLRYVKIWTTSDETSDSFPSTYNQFELGKLLSEELKTLGIKNVIHDKFGYVYATLPPSEGFENAHSIGFIAHLDTSPSVSGKDVKPVVHKNYFGNEIKFAQNEELSLSPKDSPQLYKYLGLDIITSQGDTLLGADDKAGIAEIMTACAAWQRFPELTHGLITICFFPDEEIGKGTEKIDLRELPPVCYTLDGSEMGVIENECFDAWKVELKFKGLNVHPGYAKNLMINAIKIASRFLSELPEEQSPENTEGREGFYHLSKLQGNEEEATATMILRDFNIDNNQRRMEYIDVLKGFFEKLYPGLKIELEFEHQYLNMLKFLKKEEKIVDLAKMAIEMAGVEVKVHSIRGGTDGAHLSARGIPTPNIFAGGLLFHSRKEYIPTIALQKGAEVILHLANLWIIIK